MAKELSTKMNSEPEWKYLDNPFSNYIFKGSCDFLRDYWSRPYIMLKIKVHFQSTVLRPFGSSNLLQERKLLTLMSMKSISNIQLILIFCHWKLIYQNQQNSPDWFNYFSNVYKVVRLNTSPCMVQDLGSKFAFSICSIFECSFLSSFSWVERTFCPYIKIISSIRNNNMVVPSKP